MVLERKPGTYALILHCPMAALLQIGRVGVMRLNPGYYVYLGSALGPGGIRARVAHHQNRSRRPHWHIDYLRLRTSLHSVWFSYDLLRREHEWAHAVETMRGSESSIPGFGASDCHCKSHLYFFRSRPQFGAFRRNVNAVEKRHPPLYFVGAVCAALPAESVSPHPAPTYRAGRRDARRL
jgi:Uri superfamily endonuclease